MILDKLLIQWLLHKSEAMPPHDDIVLWQQASRVIYVNKSWGPAIPYPAVRHEDGTRNHGYARLKGNLKAAQQIPELQERPEFAKFIETINRPATPIETAGCEMAYFDIVNEGGPPWMLGAYTDIIFSDIPLNERPENFLQLAATLMNAAEGCEKWWGSVELGLHRLRSLQGAYEPWGLMIRICNHGRDKDEAHKLWCETASRLGAEIQRLPKDFSRGSTERM